MRGWLKKGLILNYSGSIIAKEPKRRFPMKRTLLIALLSSVSFSQNAPERLSFDSADVHVSQPSINPTMRGGALRGGRYEVHTATMVDLIRVAYDMEPDKILGGPNWLDWDRFDVIAKAPQGTSRETLNLMLQNLLADRFKIVVHKDMSQCLHSSLQRASQR